MTTCLMSDELGAYVLHALEHDEDDEVRRHVADCDLCHEEVRELSFTVSLLSLLSLEDLEQLDVESAALEPSPAVTQPSPGPRRRALLAGAAAVAAMLAIPGARMLHSPPPPPPAATVLHATDPTTRVEAAVTLSRQDSGTRVNLNLSGAYPSGWCVLVAHSVDGQSDTAATWRADASGAAHVAGMTAIPTTRLSELDVLTDAGRVLVRIPVHDQDS
jgi:hypothetical protein